MLRRACDALHTHLGRGDERAPPPACRACIECAKPERRRGPRPRARRRPATTATLRGRGGARRAGTAPMRLRAGLGFAAPLPPARRTTHVTSAAAVTVMATETFAARAHVHVHLRVRSLARSAARPPVPGRNGGSRPRGARVPTRAARAVDAGSARVGRSSPPRAAPRDRREGRRELGRVGGRWWRWTSGNGEARAPRQDPRGVRVWVRVAAREIRFWVARSGRRLS